MSNIKVLFGRKVKELRKRLNRTQAWLAEQVNVDDKHISCIESGKSFPSADLIERLAKAFNVEPKDLFEFYYLEDKENLRNKIHSMIDNLNENELIYSYKYIKTFVIK